MPSSRHELHDILDLETLEDNLYRGRSPKVAWQRVFGGQVIAQALVAAQRTVAADRFVHSLHAYFILPGDTSVPIVYEVERVRDGRSFTTRRVVAIQHGHVIFTLSASFQIDEEGLSHQMPMPEGLPDPESLPSHVELLARHGEKVPDSVQRFWSRERPIEMRPVFLEHYTSREKLEPKQHLWIRFREGTGTDDRALQSALLAYISDLTLLDTSTFAHGRVIFDPDIRSASLDHAMWFHHPHRLDGWLLYTQDSPSSGGARGFSRGMLFSQSGTLIASVAQEGLIRLRKPAQ